MPLGMEVGLGPATMCSMGTQLPPEKGHTHSHPIFGPCQLWPNGWSGWMKTPLGTEVDLGPGHIVFDGVPAPSERGTAAPLFGPCPLWPRSPISATAELVVIHVHSKVLGTEIGENRTRWLYCVKCPQYSTRLKALGYLCDCRSGRVQR